MTMKTFIPALTLSAIACLSSPSAIADVPVQETAQAAVIQGQGIIKTLDSKHHKLTIKHEPIAALNWPAMTMGFVVAKDVDMASLKAGDAIQFDLQQQADHQFVITAIDKD